MNKYTPTGRSSVHTNPCHVAYSDSHNLRKVTDQGEIRTNPNTTIRQELTGNNTMWFRPDIDNLIGYEAKIRADYKRNNGRKMPSTGKTAAFPLRESVMNLPSNDITTDDMVSKFVTEIERRYSIQCLRWFVHRDERYDDPDTSESHFNCHAHIVWSWYDWENHKCYKLTKEDMRLWQDIAAAVTGMERGIDARVTKADGLTVAAWKNARERERGEELIEANRKLQEEVASLRTKVNETVGGEIATLALIGLDENRQYGLLTKALELQGRQEPPDDKKLSNDLKLAINVPTEGKGLGDLLVLQTKLRTLVEKMACVIHDLTKEIISISKKAIRQQKSEVAKVKALKVFKRMLDPMSRKLSRKERIDLEAKVADAEKTKGRVLRDLSFTRSALAEERRNLNDASRRNERLTDELSKRSELVAEMKEELAIANTVLERLSVAMNSSDSSALESFKNEEVTRLREAVGRVVEPFLASIYPEYLIDDMEMSVKWEYPMPTVNLSKIKCSHPNGAELTFNLDEHWQCKIKNGDVLDFYTAKIINNNAQKNSITLKR